MPLQLIANLEVMAMMRYSTLPRYPEVEPLQQIYSSVLPKTSLFLGWGGLTLLFKRYSRPILSLEILSSFDIYIFSL